MIAILLFQITEAKDLPRAACSREKVLRFNFFPMRMAFGCYPATIEESGHSGVTYFEPINFIDKIEGKETNAASIEEGSWSIVVGVAAEESFQSGKLVNIRGLLERYGITID